MLAILLFLFVSFAHLLALYFVGRYVDVGTVPDKPALVVITGTAILSWSLLASQAMELVTRAFYARSDFELILSRRSRYGSCSRCASPRWRSP